MNSRCGDRVPSGDGAEVNRGSVGTAAPVTGSARPIIAWASGLLTLLCVALAFVAGVANGLLLLATIFAAIAIWALGGFSRQLWQ